jgi:hypothetical protein
MFDPPAKNGNADVLDRRIQSNESSPNSATVGEIAQWTREARRLACEFSLTGDWRHFAALVRHVAGMSWRMNRSRLKRAVIRRLLERSTTA